MRASEIQKRSSFLVGLIFIIIAMLLFYFAVNGDLKTVGGAFFESMESDSLDEFLGDKVKIVGKAVSVTGMASEGETFTKSFWWYDTKTEKWKERELTAGTSSDLDNLYSTTAAKIRKDRGKNTVITGFAEESKLYDSVLDISYVVGIKSEVTGDWEVYDPSSIAPVSTLASDVPESNVQMELALYDHRYQSNREYQQKFETFQNDPAIAKKTPIEQKQLYYSTLTDEKEQEFFRKTYNYIPVGDPSSPIPSPSQDDSLFPSQVNPRKVTDGIWAVKDDVYTSEADAQAAAEALYQEDVDKWVQSQGKTEFGVIEENGNQVKLYRVGTQYFKLNTADGVDNAKRFTSYELEDGREIKEIRKVGGEEINVDWKVINDRLVFQSVGDGAVSLQMTQSQFNAIERMRGKEGTFEWGTDPSEPSVTVKAKDGALVYSQKQSEGIRESTNRLETFYTQGKETRQVRTEGKAVFRAETIEKESHVSYVDRITTIEYNTVYYHKETGDILATQPPEELVDQYESYQLRNTNVMQGIITTSTINQELKWDDKNKNAFVEVSGSGYVPATMTEDKKPRYSSYSGVYSVDDADKFFIEATLDPNGKDTTSYNIYGLDDKGELGDPKSFDSKEKAEAYINSDDFTGDKEAALDNLKKAQQGAQREKRRDGTYTFLRNVNQFSGLAGISSLFIDEESLAEWRETVDQWFATFYLGTEYWTSELCGKNIELANENVGFVETPSGLFLSAASIKGDIIPQPSRSDAESTFIYKITFFVRNQRHADQRAEDQTDDLDIQVVLRPGDIPVFDDELDVEAGGALVRGRDDPVIVEDTREFSQVCITFGDQFFILDDNLRTVEVEEICDNFEVGSGRPVGFTEETESDGNNTQSGGQDARNNGVNVVN